MTKEQIYITVDGRDSGHILVDVSEDVNRAWDIGELLEYILTEMTYEQQMQLKSQLIR